MFRFKFLGNTRLPHHKKTAGIAPVRMSPPAEVLIPMCQHIGAPATPIVKVGDEVKVGQVIAQESGHVSAPIHASVSGKVVKLDSILKASGKTVPAIRIASDGLMTPFEGLQAPAINTVEDLIDAARACGLVGLGGAGFPTAVKLEALKEDTIHTIIINGAECEPYITSDARTMLDHSDLISDGVALFARIVPGVKNYIIGIEKNKPECIKEMERIFGGNAAVSVKGLPLLYPQGAEKVLIRNTTGLTVPEGKLPKDVGVIVINVTTLATLANYAKTGMPLVERCVTVDGSAIKEPKNVIVPIGTSIRELVEFAGGFSEDPGKVILGGPMTGNTVYSLDEPVVKTTGSVLALSLKDSLEQEPTACIHCGKCVDVCPHFLTPTAFNKAMTIENVEEKMATLEELSVHMCMECGCCSYVCPANRPLSETNRIAKNALRDYKAYKASLK